MTSSGPVDVVSGERTQILENGQLLIVTAVSTDSGHYVCNASNSRGSQTAEAFLEVYGKTCTCTHIHEMIRTVLLKRSASLI